MEHPTVDAQYKLLPAAIAFTTRYNPSNIIF
jgi:hypothetical protein